METMTMTMTINPQIVTYTILAASASMINPWMLLGVIITPIVSKLSQKAFPKEPYMQPEHIETFVKHVNLNQIDEVKKLYQTELDQLNNIKKYRPIEKDITHHEGRVKAIEMVCNMLNISYK